MVLDKQRDNIDPLLSKLAKPFFKANPDVLTWLSLLCAIAAGCFFYFSTPEAELENYFLYGAIIFVFLNGFFDAIDGKVAKMTDSDSKKGDFLDHALDRYADVFMLGGLALSGWNQHAAVGLLAVVGMLLTSYMGTQSQAVGMKREYSGLLGRADRLVLLMIFPIVQHILLHYSFKLPLNLFLLEWVLVYFAVVGNLTAIQRFLVTLLSFKKQ
ncbi:MAG: CDP-alcohol phosphatidyltransferase family protein [Candidatus Thermoplasmatota archaeon]